jgi:hypothetical protein
VLVVQNVGASDPILAAAAFGGAVKLMAPSCVTHARDPVDPDVALITLTDCTGPFGLVQVDGEETVTFGAGAGGALHLGVTGMGLTANGRPVSFSASADVTFPTDATRNVVWDGTWTRTDEAGDKVDHMSDLQISVDLQNRCTTADGSATTTVADRGVDTSIAGYALCRDPTTGRAGCPMGTVTHTGRSSGRTVTVRFDGTNVAHVTESRGNTFPVDLICAPLP